MAPVHTCRAHLMSDKTQVTWEILCKTVHSETQCLPRIINLYGLVFEEGRVFILFVIDYEFSIIDHHNKLN